MLLCQIFHFAHPLRDAHQVQFVEEVDDMFVGGKTLISQIVLRGSFLQQFVFIIKEYRCLLVQPGNIMQHVQPGRIVWSRDINAQQAVFYNRTSSIG